MFPYGVWNLNLHCAIKNNMQIWYSCMNAQNNGYVFIVPSYVTVIRKKWNGKHMFWYSTVQNDWSTIYPWTTADEIVFFDDSSPFILSVTFQQTISNKRHKNIVVFPAARGREVGVVNSGVRQVNLRRNRSIAELRSRTGWIFECWFLKFPGEKCLSNCFSNR